VYFGVRQRNFITDFLKVQMAYTEKFQRLADVAMSQVVSIEPDQVDRLLAEGAVALDIRDKEEHDADHLAGSLHVSRGKLEMNIEGVIPDLVTKVMCYCNANNRGALSANTLRQLGYVNACYIAGGLKAYRALR
jgi:rhodanese-related sulfurtransferase